MKNLIILLLLVAGINAAAQVAINTDSSIPDNSAMLDVKSTTKGMLAPRMTIAQRNAISNPATGLTIFQTDGLPGLYYNSGIPAIPVWSLVGSNAGQWLTNGTNIYYNLGNVGIGVSNPTANLDIRGSSTDIGSMVNIGNSDISHRLTLFGGRQNDPNPFIQWKNGDPLRFATDAGGWSEKMRITGLGLVGIGTDTPLERLHVNGKFYLSNTMDYPFIFLDNSFSGGHCGLVFNYNSTNMAWMYYDQNDNQLVLNAENGSGFRKDMVITSTGNVGIGAPYPASHFHVADVAPGQTATFGSPIAGWTSSTNVNIGDDNGPSILYIGQNDNNKGFLYWQYNATPANAYYHIGTYGGANPLVLQAEAAAGGKVGIGTTAPAALFHVAENSPNYTAVFGTPISGTNMSTNVSVGDDNASAVLYVGQSTQNKGLLKWDYDLTPSNAYFAVGTYAGLNPLILQEGGGKVGIGTTMPGSLLDVQYDGYTHNYLGYSNSIGSYFYHNELDGDGDGQAALYAYRTRVVQNDGATYGLNTTNTAMKGYSLWGDLYSFGTAGFNDNDFSRCGGILGSQSGGGYWGALGYKNSSYSGYGGYFSSYTNGSGKSSQVNTGIGIGAWGDLMGADIHGKVYGVYAEGENYSMYSNGPVYKNNIDVHLQDNGTGTNTVLYTNVSTDVTVMTSGYATLSNGAASIDFDPDFAASISTEAPVIVTVTPMGNSNWVYLSEVTDKGFTVNESNNGKSSIKVSYIAIGKRAGYEHPNLPREVIDAGYTGNMTRGLHNDADTQTNGEGLYYQNGQLVVGIHPTSLPDPNKPAEETVIPKPGTPPVKSPANPNSSIGVGETGQAKSLIPAKEKPAVNSPSGGTITPQPKQQIKPVIEKGGNASERSK
jgi:hypothetical protein